MNRAVMQKSIPSAEKGRRLPATPPKTAPAPVKLAHKSHIQHDLSLLAARKIQGVENSVGLIGQTVYHIRFGLAYFIEIINKTDAVEKLAAVHK